MTTLFALLIAATAMVGNTVAALWEARGSRLAKYGRPVWLQPWFLAGLLADYVIGMPWLGVYIGDVTGGIVQSLVFVPGDLIKIVLAALIASLVHRALPDLLPVRSASSEPRVR